MNTNINTVVKGHVLIQDRQTGEILLDKDNAIHPQNMAAVIARGLANEPNFQIFKVGLGNGGTYIDAGLNIVYNPPNVVGSAANLYNETYTEIIDDGNVGVGSGNSVISQASPLPAITQQVICTVILAPNEPSGQAPSDGVTTNPDSLFTFDELGLKTADAVPLLLSHIIFSPIEKTANREMIVTYTLTISVS